MLSRAPGPVNQSSWGKTTRSWLWVLCLLCSLFSASATLPPEVNADCGPDLCPCQACPKLPSWWEIKSPHSCSFTDQFLEFLSQRAQAITAAEQIGQEEQDALWGENPQADPPTRAQGDLNALQDRGGERHWRFYRPDPFAVGRSLMLDLHVLADHTLEYVEGRNGKLWQFIIP